MTRVRAAIAAFMLLGTALSVVAPAHADRSSLRQVLEKLARQHGFTISGLKRISEKDAPSKASGPLSDRLGALLRKYNYFLVHRASGGVETVHIVGRKAVGGNRQETAVIPTVRSGAHHIVDATLMTRSGARVTEPLIVDTGASTVVLPLSMAKELGIDPDSLEPVEMRTANGVVSMLRGELWAVQIADIRVKDVAVTFVDDDRAGKVKLLGMSFLRGFRVLLDDKNARMMLMREAE